MEKHRGRARGGLVSVGLALALGLSMAAPATAGDRSWDDSWDDETWQDSGHDGSRGDVTSPEARTLVDGLVSPALGLAVGSRRTVYVSQTFAGILSKIDRDGTRTDVVPSEPEGSPAWMSGATTG